MKRTLGIIRVCFNHSSMSLLKESEEIIVGMEAEEAVGCVANLVVPDGLQQGRYSGWEMWGPVDWVCSWPGVYPSQVLTSWLSSRSKVQH